jgi:CHAD domain-containing protein
MSGTVELVLAIEAAAASEWMAGPAAEQGNGRTAAAGVKAAGVRKQKAGTRRTAARALAPADAGAAVADALSRMPGIVEVGAVYRSTVRAFVEPEGTWRIMLADAGDEARRITVVRADELTPGIWRCQTLCDEAGSESLSAQALLAFGETAPEALKAVLGKPEKFASIPALTVSRRKWRWEGPDGAVVDIELHDARAGFDRFHDPAIASATPPRPEAAAPVTAADQRARSAVPMGFCELRLVSWIDRAQATIHAVAGSPHAAAEPEPPQEGKHAESNAEAREQSAAEHSAVHALFAAAGALIDTLPVFPSLIDGYARACLPSGSRAPVRAARVDLRHAKTPHDALIAVAANIARQWFGNEGGVRDGARDGTEFLHQMRVALRRLKTWSKTFSRWADDTWERTIATDLDWLGTQLGQARDLDVFVDTTLPMLVAADVDPAAWAPLQARAGARRGEARAQVQAALRTRRYAVLSLAWLRWLTMQRFSEGPSSMAGKPLADYAAKRVRKHYRRLVAKPGLPELTPAERHRRRIEAKRLRYTLEFFQPLASRKTRRKIAKQLGAIQSVLGDGSDATAALRFLEALDAPAYVHGFARGWCEAVNRWSAIEGERLLRELGKPKIIGAW